MNRENINQNLDTVKEKQKQIIKYAKSMTNMPLDGVVTIGQRNKMMKKYDKEDIAKYLENPSKYESQLREVVDYLCTISPQFCRLIEYVPNMAIITPYAKQKMNNYTKNKKKIKAEFIDMCNYLDTLEMKTTGARILKEVFKYGVFYGLEVEGTYSTYVKKLNPNLCKVITEGELGLGIAFDFSYFNGNQYVLKNSYPKFFEQLYEDYQKGKKISTNLDAKWQPLPIESTYVIKYDITNLDYSVPPYVNIFSALYDLEEYQSLNKAKVTAENYTLIGLKIPTLSNATDADSYAISNDMIDATTEQLDESLPEYMGYFTTATEIETVKASTSSDNKIDNVANAIKNVWNGSGFAESIFGVDNNNSGTLEYSIKTDEQQLFSIYDQMQKHWDLKLKRKFSNNFKLILLRTTWFNITKMIEDFMSASQTSIPVILAVPLLLGFEMSDIDDMVTMQEDIFDIFNRWKAPQSSYTNSTSNKDVGKPKSEGGLNNSGDQTNNNDSNNKR